MTGQSWLNLYVSKVMGFADLESRFSTSLRDELRQQLKDFWDAGGTLDEAGRLGFTIASSLASISGGGTYHGYDGEGNRLEAVGTADAAWTSVPFLNAGGPVYYTGAKLAVRPGAAEFPGDGIYAYAYHVDDVGEIVTPSSVIDNADGTVTLVISTAFPHDSWGTATDTRPVYAWLVNPVTDSAEAIFSGTAAYDGVDVRIEVNVGHQFGQTGTPSTTAADYRILVRGPTITTTDISTNSDYWYLGYIQTSFHWNATQPLLSPFSVTATAFGAQHNPTTGVHTAISATSVSSTGAISGTSLTGTSLNTGSGSISGGTIGGSYGNFTARVDIEGSAYPLLRVTPSSSSYDDNVQGEFRDSANNAKVQVIPGRSTYADEGGIIRFPNPDRSTNDTASIEVGPQVGTVWLKLTNPNGTGDECGLEIDGIIRKDPAKTEQFAIEANEAGLETLYMRNVGAGVLDLNLDGDFFCDNVQITTDLTVLTNSHLQGAVYLSSTIDQSTEGLGVFAVDASGWVAGEYFTAPGALAANKPAMSYGGAEQEFSTDLSPHGGGWFVIDADGTPFLDTNAGNPPYVYCSDNSLITIRRSLGDLLQYSNDRTTSPFYLKNVQWRSDEDSGSIVMYLKRVLRDGSGSPSTLDSQNAPSGGFTLNTMTINQSVSVLYYYYLELSINPTTSATDCKIADVVINYDKSEIE